MIDPAAGAPVRGPWRTVSVAAGTCADANTAATAALVRQARAPAWLDRLGLPARLVAHDGAVLSLAGWPADSVTHGRPVRPPRRSQARPPCRAATGVPADAGCSRPAPSALAGR